jgi:hypothetical protein
LSSLVEISFTREWCTKIDSQSIRREIYNLTEDNFTEEETIVTVGFLIQVVQYIPLS